MTNKELLTIYDVIRRSEFRRRELQRLIVQKRDDAVALRSPFLGVRVSSGIRTAPQERYIDNVSDYEEQLTRTVRNADELSKRFFYNVQRRVTWREAMAIHGFLTGSAPYCRQYAQAVRRMAQALTDGAKTAAAWNEEAKDFTPGERCYIPQHKPLTQQQELTIAETVLRSVHGRRLCEIVEIIRRKCRRRNHAEKGSREDETLYAQICALERAYIYGQKCLTENELFFIELYMTDELTSGEIRENADTIQNAIEKLSAARKEKMRLT